MTKFSQLPPDSTPTITDEVATRDVESGSNKRVTVQDLITLFFNNIPANTPTATSLAADVVRDHVTGGTGVITADSAGVNRNASMTAVTAYINGQKGTVNAVSARTYTASKDTYVDLLNTAGTFTLVYTEVSNNAASPALAANSIRLGIVVTGATTIATSGSINQGQQDRLLPITSSTPYAVTDSLGNVIFPNDPQRRLLGYRQVSALQSGITGEADLTGLSVPFIASGSRKIRAIFDGAMGNSASDTPAAPSMKESSTYLQGRIGNTGTAGTYTFHFIYEGTPTAGLHTYKMVAQRSAGAGSVNLQAATPTNATNGPASFRIEQG